MKNKLKIVLKLDIYNMYWSSAKNKIQREKGQWSFYYTSPQSFKIMFSYLLALQLWGLLLKFG